jgi:tetratricopeptide (TPR) repeat protein
MALDEQSLTLDLLVEATTRIRTWLNRRHLADIRADFFIQRGQFEEALAAALEYEQLGRSAGRDVPCRSAFLLAKLARVSEAGNAVEESLSRLPSLHPSRRPDYYLARALWELGRSTEAVSHAREAYERAWGDGPPHCDYWALRDTRALLQAMRVPEPQLRITDPATISVPLENAILAFIAAMEVHKSNDEASRGIGLA